MNIIEKIKAEIERRIELYNGATEKEKWICNTYKAVLSFLSTLEEESKHKSNALFDKCVENCDSEIKKSVELELNSIAFLEELGYTCIPPSELDEIVEAAEVRVTENGRFELGHLDKLRIDDIVWGAEWERAHNKVKEEPVCDELEDAANDFSKEYESGPNRIAKNAFIAGANWQKEKMMKEKDHKKPNMVEELRHHLATTPKEQLDKEWEELEEWGKIGPTVSEFLGWQKPVCEELEEIIKRLWEEINTGHNYSIIDSYEQFYGICLDIARWQKEKDNRNQWSISTTPRNIQPCPDG